MVAGAAWSAYRFRLYASPCPGSTLPSHELVSRIFLGPTGPVLLCWEATPQPAYIKAGELSGEIDPATFLDGSLIASANAFDDAAIKADLEAWNAANP